MSNHPHGGKDHKSQTGILPGGKVEVLFFWTSMAYFCGKSMFFALRIRERLFPDEASWFGLVRVFSRVAWLPVDSPESYPFGLVTHIPNLYFFLLGKALVWNVFPVSDLLFLRLVNVGIGVMTILFSWRLVCLLTDLLAVRWLFLTMLTNTLMLTFLFGAVSYDNLLNLLSVMALYFFCAFSLRRQVKPFLWAVISVLAGCLTKITFLPLALLLALAILWRERRHLRDVPRYFRTIFFPTIKVGQLMAWLLIVVLAGAGIKLYGGNWVKYSQLSPSSDAVVGLENALQYRIFARNYTVDSYKNGRISWLDAQRLALQVREESDRQETLYLLRMAREEKLHRAPVAPRMGRWEYSVVWLGRIVPKVFGIMAHKNMLKDSWAEMAPYFTLLAVALLGFLARLRSGDTGLKVSDHGVSFESSALPPNCKRLQGAADARNRSASYSPLCEQAEDKADAVSCDRLRLKGCGFLLSLVTFGYLLILMEVVNYSIYRTSGVLDLALQGRYTFPVLVPLYILCAYYFVIAWPSRLRLWSTATLGVFFVLGEFPWFIRHVTPDWFF